MICSCNCGVSFRIKTAMEENTIVEVTETRKRSLGVGSLRKTLQGEMEDSQEEIGESDGPWNEVDMGKRYKKLLESGYMSDVTIQVENTKFQCHSIIVSASSPKIAKKVRKSKTLELKNVAPNHFNFLLEIIYGGFAENLSNVEDILGVAQASKDLQVYSALAYCTKILRTNINPTSACQILEFAELVGDEALKESCIKVIQERTDEVLANETFINCKHATLELILSQKVLHGVTELDLFLACARWAKVRHQPRQALGSALGLIRFRQIQSIDFAEKVMPTNLLTADEEKCLEIYFLIGEGEMPERFSNEKKERREIQVETSKINVCPEKEFTFLATSTDANWLKSEELSQYSLQFS